MALSSIVTSVTTLAASASIRPGFGTGLILGPVTAPQEALFGSALTVEIQPDNYETVLAGLGFATSDPHYVAAVDHFSQNPRPQRAYVGRRATPVAQVTNVSVDDTTDGTYRITLQGVNFDFVASSNTATEIRDGLIALVSADPDYGAAIGAGDSLDITAAAAGVPFSVAVSSPTGAGLSFTTTTPNVGYPEDIAAIIVENNLWYALLPLDQDDGNIRALAEAIEPRPKVAFPLSTAAAIGTSVTTDIASLLRDSGFQRTGLIVHDDGGEQVPSAWAGRCLPEDAGSITWAFKQLSSVTGLTEDQLDTEETNYRFKNANWLEQFSALGVTSMQNARMADGTFIDLVRGRDWLDANIALDIFDALHEAGKIPYTDEGIAILVGVLSGRLQAGVAQGIIVDGSIEIDVPSVADATTDERANRCAPDINWRATLQGAIHKVNIRGTLSV